MRKILLGLVAIAAIAGPPSASAGSANAAIGPVTRTATFTAIQPADAFSQFDNVWMHVFAVNVDANGTFEGTGVINGHDSQTTMTDAPENVTGTFNADGTISLARRRPHTTAWCGR